MQAARPDMENLREWYNTEVAVSIPQPHHCIAARMEDSCTSRRRKTRSQLLTPSSPEALEKGHYRSVLLF